MVNHGIALRSTRSLGKFPSLHTDTWLMIGQDGGQSIDLGDRTLFLFSDTLLAELRPVHRPHRPAPLPTPLDGQGGIFLANCAAISAADTFRDALADMRYYTDDEGFPREILEPTPAERSEELRFWPEHGILVDGAVYFYYLGIETVDPSSIWGFRNVGVGLARLDPATGQVERIRRDGDWRMWQINSDDFHFGVQVLQEGEYVYVFGTKTIDYVTTGLVARVRPAQITDPDAYEYMCSEGPDWSSKVSDACSLGTCSSEFSLSYNAHVGKYLMTYVDGERKAIMVRAAERLLGPYSPPQKIIRVPYEPASEMIYLGFEHPKFRKDGDKTMYVSYCQPAFTPNMLVELRLG